jgi:hypothetical protein
MSETCQGIKPNKATCKRSVATGQTLCWQHARGLSGKLRSLTLAHKLTILSITVAIFFGVQRMLSSGPSISNTRVQSSGDNSPNVVGNSGKVDIQTGQSQPKKPKTGTQK